MGTTTPNNPTAPDKQRGAETLRKKKGVRTGHDTFSCRCSQNAADLPLRRYVDLQAPPFFLIPPPQEGRLCERTHMQGPHQKARQHDCKRMRIDPFCGPGGPTPGSKPKRHEQPRAGNDERDFEPRTPRRTVDCFFHEARQKDDAGQPRGYGENGAKGQD